MKKYFLGQVAQKAILKYKDAFVLVKEKNQEEWILPGGRLDSGESPEEGLRREIQEELSIDVEIKSIISIDSYHGEGRSKVPKVFIFYSVIALPKQDIKINHEVEEFMLVSKKSEIENLPMFTNQREVIEKVLK